MQKLPQLLRYMGIGTGTGTGTGTVETKLNT